MTDLSFHLAPNAPWIALLALSLALLALSRWAYRFAIPPLPGLARRALPALRMLALVLLVWLLAQPVLERVRGGETRVVVLLDRSRSMELPATAGGASRAALAERVVAELKRAWRGRAAVEVLGFASRLESDSARAGNASATALGDALAALAASPAGARASGVVVVSDGATNAGQDPVAAARALGLPVHVVVVGEGAGLDRTLTAIDASARARVGEATPVRVRIASSEPRGTPLRVTLTEPGHELGRATVIAPGSGAEVTAEFRPLPARAGLAVWTARVDSLSGEISTANNAREVAIEVAPGKLAVLIVSAGPNWDLAFLRRALRGDSSLAVTTRARERGGWRDLERARGAELSPSDLRGQAVVVLDGIAPAAVSAEFDRALATFVRDGGGLLLFGGGSPGLTRFEDGALGRDLALDLIGGFTGRSGAPLPTPDARELLAWDDDPARGDQAWRAAAPVLDLTPVAAGAGDRVFIAGPPHGPPILFARRIGRGQALLVNGAGLWRWSLAQHDELSPERGRRLWRRIARWLAEPVQGEPLRVTPERRLFTRGEPARMFATLQDEAFRPVAGASVEGDLAGPNGTTRHLRFEGAAAGSYAASLDDLPPGAYRVSARATRGGHELGHATSEFAVDRWSLEEARTQPDSATLAAMAGASGGQVTGARDVGRWARGLETRNLARGRSESTRLWESPWVFAFVVGALSIEWAWRRRRGLA